MSVVNHITHLEDLIITRGQDGLDIIIDFMENPENMKLLET